jgi:pyruvate kinase
MFLGSKTKIIATLGPATKDRDILRQMILAGLDVFRLNFSHGTHQDKLEIIKLIRELESELNVNVAILGDLQGPKLRIGDLDNEPRKLVEKEILVFTTDPRNCEEGELFISYPNFAKDVAIGDVVLIDDGKIKLQVIQTDKTKNVKAQVIYGGDLYSRKGVNLPDTKISMPSLTDKDKQDVLFALNNDLDWLALSFVRTVNDIEYLKEYIAGFRKKINIIAKIEKGEAVKNLDAIIRYADGIMVARGDLGVELSFESVPVIQKTIVEKCILASKPVIIATQMLESMITNFRPTRAEATDVANAVLDGADALMLSGETSVGKFPVDSIRAMQSIIDYTEANCDIYFKNHQPDVCSNEFLPDSICYNACVMAQQTNAKAIITFTFSGRTAVRLSSHRPKAEIFAFTANKDLLRELPLLWGVNTFYFPLFDSIDQAIDYSINILKQQGLVKEGDLVIHVASTPITAKDRTNMIKLSRVV